MPTSILREASYTHYLNFLYKAHLYQEVLACEILKPMNDENYASVMIMVYKYEDFNLREFIRVNQVAHINDLG